MFERFGSSVLKHDQKMELKKYWAEYIEKVDDALNRPPLKERLKMSSRGLSELISPILAAKFPK